MTGRRPRKPEPSSSAVSDDDLDLFAREVENALPLAPDARGRMRPASSKRGNVAARSVRHQPPTKAEADDDERTLESYAAPGVDRRELRKLGRGAYQPELRLDLHGLTVPEAVAQVARVLDLGPGRRPRCLCVVHGRGLRSAGNIAVLKPRVRDYLRTRPIVLAFADAPQDDGGQGAVYVLLRR